VLGDVVGEQPRREVKIQLREETQRRQLGQEQRRLVIVTSPVWPNRLDLLHDDARWPAEAGERQAVDERPSAPTHDILDGDDPGAASERAAHEVLDGTARSSGKAGNHQAVCQNPPRVP
jgi:hypothetical protein